MIGWLLRSLNGFSYKEKSALISLLALAGLYGAYFLEVAAGGGAQTLSAMLARMLAIVVGLVVVHIVFHIVISLDDVSEADDERDRAVKRRAAVYGYNVLGAGVLIVLGRILILGAWSEKASVQAVPDSVQIAHLLLAGMVVSELVYYGAQLVFYRRGVHG